MKSNQYSKMKLKFFALFLLLITNHILNAQCPKLVWSDEFNGTSLDQTKWSYQIGDGCDINLCQWGNNELQWYTQSNTQVSEGTLKITAKRETVNNRAYTSSRIRTLNKGDIKYGRVEARMKLPTGQGIWPAFWMLPTDNVYGQWPLSGEIDIMEYIGSEPSNIFGTLHYGNLWPNNRYLTRNFTLIQGNFNEAFHDYAMEWTENEIRWYIDGYLYGTTKSSDLAGFRWPFDQKFHFILNLAVGGTLPGNPNSSTVFPQTFEVDYVRVYDLVGAPHLSGQQKVAFAAKNSAYSIVNAPAGSTIKWTVPAGATIVSGDGTKDILVNWGSTGGKITANVTTSCGETKHELIVLVEAAFKSAVVLENFDAEGKITRTSSTGTFTDNFATPSPNSINSSALCGKYERNAGQQFDVLFYNVSDVTNAADFTSAEKRFYIDIYTNAPIGTQILLQLENKNQAQPTNYPTGRHSRFAVNTTKQNEWERLTFLFLDRPDAQVSNQAVNQMVVLFAPNSNTGNTYYFDNFEIYAKSTNGTKDINEKIPVTLYPNPTTNILNIAVEKDKTIEQIEIFDSLGRKIRHQKGSNIAQTEVDIQALKSGLYYITVSLGNGDRTIKQFVKL